MLFTENGTAPTSAPAGQVLARLRRLPHRLALLLLVFLTSLSIAAAAAAPVDRFADPARTAAHAAVPSHHVSNLPVFADPRLGQGDEAALFEPGDRDEDAIGADSSSDASGLTAEAAPVATPAPGLSYLLPPASAPFRADRSPAGFRSRAPPLAG